MIISNYDNIGVVSCETLSTDYLDLCEGCVDIMKCTVYGLSVVSCLIMWWLSKLVGFNICIFMDLQIRVKYKSSKCTFYRKCCIMVLKLTRYLGKLVLWNEIIFISEFNICENYYYSF